jgi:hypothetical protein
MSLVIFRSRIGASEAAIEAAGELVDMIVDISHQLREDGIAWVAIQSSARLLQKGVKRFEEIV